MLQQSRRVPHGHACTAPVRRTGKQLVPHSPAALCATRRSTQHVAQAQPTIFSSHVGRHIPTRKAAAPSQQQRFLVTGLHPCTRTASQAQVCLGLLARTSCRPAFMPLSCVRAERKRMARGAARACSCVTSRCSCRRICSTLAAAAASRAAAASTAVRALAASSSARRCRSAACRSAPEHASCGARRQARCDGATPTLCPLWSHRQYTHTVRICLDQQQHQSASWARSACAECPSGSCTCRGPPGFPDLHTHRVPVGGHHGSQRHDACTRLRDGGLGGRGARLRGLLLPRGCRGVGARLRGGGLGGRGARLRGLALPRGRRGVGARLCGGGLGGRSARLRGLALLRGRGAHLPGLRRGGCGLLPGRLLRSAATAATSVHSNVRKWLAALCRAHIHTQRGSAACSRA